LNYSGIPPSFKLSTHEQKQGESTRYQKQEKQGSSNTGGRASEERGK